MSKKEFAAVRHMAAVKAWKTRKANARKRSAGRGRGGAKKK